RRHTRCYRDWSSDVCSSDLNVPSTDIQIGEPSFKKWQDKLEDHQNEGEDDEGVHDEWKLRPLQRLAETGSYQHPSREDNRKIPEIGRASCREREKTRDEWTP